jgi:hypothetical protein
MDTYNSENHHPKVPYLPSFAFARKYKQERKERKELKERKEKLDNQNIIIKEEEKEDDDFINPFTTALELSANSYLSPNKSTINNDYNNNKDNNYNHYYDNNITTTTTTTTNNNNNNINNNNINNNNINNNNINNNIKSPNLKKYNLSGNVYKSKSKYVLQKFTIKNRYSFSIYVLSIYLSIYLSLSTIYNYIQLYLFCFIIILYYYPSIDPLSPDVSIVEDPIEEPVYIKPGMYLSVYLSIYLSIYFTIYLFIYFAIYLCIYPFIYLSSNKEPILKVEKIVKSEPPIEEKTPYIEPKKVVSKQHIRTINKIKSLNLSNLPSDEYDISKVGPLKPGYDFINFLLSCDSVHVKTLQVPIPHTVVLSDKAIQVLTTDRLGYLSADTNVVMNNQEERDRFILSCMIYLSNYLSI